MLFLLLSLPLNLVLLGLFFWYCSMRPRSFAATLLGSAALSALVVALALTHYKHIVSPRQHCWLAGCLPAWLPGWGHLPWPQHPPLLLLL